MFSGFPDAAAHLTQISDSNFFRAALLKASWQSSSTSSVLSTLYCKRYLLDLRVTR